MFSGKYPPRRLFRRWWNQKHKKRDRYKPKGWAFEFLPISYGKWRYMYGEKDWRFNRRKAPTETGYGISYERRPDAELFD